MSLNSISVVIPSERLQGNINTDPATTAKKSHLSNQSKERDDTDVVLVGSVSVIRLRAYARRYLSYFVFVYIVVTFSYHLDENEM